MSSKTSSPPTVQEMGTRILENLTRVQGYLDILKAEIDDPQKIGPGTDRADWVEATQALTQSLQILEQFLKNEDWGSANE